MGARWTAGLGIRGRSRVGSGAAGGGTRRDGRGTGGPSHGGGGGFAEPQEFKHAGGRCDRRLGSLQVTRRVAR